MTRKAILETAGSIGFAALLIIWIGFVAVMLAPDMVPLIASLFG